MIRRRARRGDLVDAAFAAYTRWRSERDAVGTAYRVWIAASSSDEPSAFEAYQAALDREERAAKTYAGLISRAGHVAESRRAHHSSWVRRAQQLAWMLSLPGAS